MNNRKFAEIFADSMFDLIIAAGANRSTAHHCVAEWWKAIEQGKFGPAESEQTK